MRNIKDTIKTPEELWKTTKYGVQLNYPIFHYDPNSPFDLNFKNSVEDVIEDIQFWDWEWDKRERIIDSSGKVFKSEFRTNESMPSGVFPGSVERQMELKEVKQMFEVCLKVNPLIPNEKFEVLQNRLEITQSIKKIFMIGERFF